MLCHRHIRTRRNIRARTTDWWAGLCMPSCLSELRPSHNSCLSVLSTCWRQLYVVYHRLFQHFLFHYWSAWPFTPLPSASWQGVCVGVHRADMECGRAFVCVCAVYQGMNKSQRAWVCFPWHGLRLNSRSLHPDIRLSFSPKPQQAEKSTKQGGISIFCPPPPSSARFVDKSSPHLFLSRWKTSPLPLPCSLCAMNERKREQERER